MDKSGLISRIQKYSSTFSKGHQRIAQYITTHYDKAAFMTAEKLGEMAGVSESTVVRFAVVLGYEGYPMLQRAMQELILSKLTAVQRIEVSDDRLDQNDVLRSVLTKDAEKIQTTLEEISKKDFDAVVETLLSANRIYILGARSSASLASFMSFYFNLIFEDVRLVQTDGIGEIFEHILRVKKGDAVVGISFPRYSRRTIQSLAYAKTQGADTIAITDGPRSPLTAHADLALFAGSDMASFADSLVAPLSVINALIVACGLRRRAQTYEALNRLETLWAEYQIYEQPEGE
ncbi:MAG TPA: MurR/RpiR family transcriptional regulator [Clostridiales bacterium]|jgi:DNA-binding MurR/RpiR family transcriptional regulator|nr:MurR/RpiR family transcriptional regulator [Clostridiales bacterium]